MKKAVIGVGLLICGMMELTTQRIVDSIFTANNWQMSQSGGNLLVTLGWVALLAGAVLCVLALKSRD
ncbi:MAG: hypothetical protein ACOX7F_06815 [Eubacteriales bacterium]|jgi:hypothetical protein